MTTKHDNTPSQDGTKVGSISTRLKEFSVRLQSEHQTLDELEKNLTKRILQRESIVQHLNETFNKNITKPQKIADTVARVGGSWPFVISALLTIAGWMVINIYVLTTRSFDPYPFILLNLVLSCLAALQAPIILMSQNRSSARDHLQAELDFRVNLKAEFEIAALHKKVDHLLYDRWKTLLDMQELQLLLLHELDQHISASKIRS